MAHQNGRCASDDETIYVRSDCASGAAGTSSSPACSVAEAAKLVRVGRTVISVSGSVLGGTIPTTPSQVSVIGGTTSGLELAPGANVYVRGVHIGPSPAVGLTGRKDSVLIADSIVVDGNIGGGLLLDGSSFKISRSTISNNGPGQDGTIVWGGVLVRSVGASGAASLDHVSIINNKQVGLTCDGGIFATGVLATGNVGGVDVAHACGMWNACTVPSPDCGAPQ